jgi:RNA polymerase sigma-70 factor (ECF subfamily)
MKAPSLPLIGITEHAAAPIPAPADLRAALERHHAECVGWAMACCGFDRNEASDVLQDSYLKVLDGRAVFRGESAFRTWLFGVVRRTASEHRRSLGKLLTVSWRADRHDPPTAEPDAAVAMDAQEAAGRLRGALRVLPRRQREVLHLVFQQELTVEAAAAVMGVSVGSARTHYARGKARLRALLNREVER